MNQISPSTIVGVRFSKVGKIYHFDASKINTVNVGDVIVVETSRGWQLGTVAVKVEDPQVPPEGGWKQIDRLATPRDLLLRQSWQAKEEDVVMQSKARARELRLQGVKIISAEYSYDGSRLSIFFSSDSEDKVELKSLRPDLQKAFAPSQVDLRQIGPRDVAKFLGGMGACGLESRCCARFLTEFSSISIRMAKEQGISLTPAEITGMCGRLRCCLIYEYENYVEARKLLPKKNKRVITPDGEGKVVDIQPLREVVVVEFAESGRKEYHKSEIKPAEEYEAFVKKAESGSGGGGCQNCPQKAF
jgi:cell fate regulator YaaT (PSP1 superfamily)